jgi:biotin transporter BioY
MSQIKDSSNNIVSEKKDSANTITDTAKNSDNYFDQNTLILIIGFLAVYFIIHFVLGFFYNKEDPNYHSLKSRMVDVVVIGLIGAYIAYYYFSMSQKDKDEFLPRFIAGTKAYLNNSYSILEVGLFLLLFYIGAFIIGIPMSSENKPSSIQFFESKVFMFLIILLIIQFFKYFLKVPIVDILFGDFSSLGGGSTSADADTGATAVANAAAATAVMPDLRLANAAAV